MKKEQALKIIFQCAAKFEENLANRNLLFVCSDKKMNISIVYKVKDVEMHSISLPENVKL